MTLNAGMFEGDRARKERALPARRSNWRAGTATPTSSSSTLAYLGASLVHADRTEEGMLLLDEALAAVGGQRRRRLLSSCEEIFCQLFSACEHAHDVARADQWIRIGEAIAARRNLPAVSAFCRTHYGGVLTAAGRWPEADATLTEAVRLWGLGHRSLRGGALVRLADLRVRQGRFEEAEQLLDGLDGADAEAARPLAAIHLARGETALARDVLERALDAARPARAPRRRRCCTLLVDVHLASGELDAAERDGRAGSARVRRASTRADYLARLRRARPRPALPRDGRPATRRPASARRSPASPGRRCRWSSRTARLELANALAADRPEVAMAEARAALDAFEQLQAARDADAAAARPALARRRPATGPRRTAGS